MPAPVVTVAGAILARTTDAARWDAKRINGTWTSTRLRELLTQEGDGALEGEIGGLGSVGIA